MKLRPELILAFIVAFLLLIRVSGEPQQVEIVLKPTDYGYITHVEYVPKPHYTHKSLVASEVARELLLKNMYGEPLPEQLLSFIIKCGRNGYFTATPDGAEPNWESTFYATWLFTEIGLEPKVDPALLYSVVNSSLEFRDAYYAFRALSLLGYNVTKDMLDDFDLGYAASFIRGSVKPSVESTVLWLLVFSEDEAKVKWLSDMGVNLTEYGGWISIEYLMVRRPVYVNATVYPRVVVDRAPEPLHVEAVRWPRERLNYTFRCVLEGDRLVSYIRADGRILKFMHRVARRDYAVLKVSQRLGGIHIEFSYRPKCVLKLTIAGLTLSWNITSYSFSTDVELPAYGSFRIHAEVVGEDIMLKGEGTIFLETSYERKLIDLAFMALPTTSSIIGIIASERRRRLKLTCILASLQAPPLLALDILEIHPIWITLTYGGITLALTYFIDKEAFNRAVNHIAVLTFLSATSIIIGNPIVLMLGGFGAALFLLSALLYPSEFSKTERFYKSTMLLYSLGVLSMAFLNETAVSIANFMYAPDSGFIDAVRTQTMFIANLFSLTPVVAPIYHLAKLIHSYERAREAREVLRELTRF